jgi:hypothetical protein
MPCPAPPTVSIRLVGSEQHKSRPDPGSDSGFWLRIKPEDAAPFIAAFKDSPDLFHEFRIEHRLGKEIRASTLCAQILKVEEGPAETQVIRPHPSYGAPY